MSDRQRLRFTEFEEAILHLEQATGPWNIQLEVSADGALDEARLRAAVTAACLRHPLARARLRYWKGADTTYRWFVPDALDLDPVTTNDAADDAALAVLRRSTFSPAIDLDLSPLLRVVLVRRPVSDLVLFAFSHVAFDGLGALRFVQSVTRTYRGAEDPEPPISLEEARTLDAHLVSSSLKDMGARALEGPRRLREALDAPARLAKAGATDEDGFGFVDRTLVPSKVPAMSSARAEGASINDVLVAALHIAVDRWNRSHGATSNRIGLMMPVNTRPPEWFWDVVSNFASFVTVSTHPADRADLETATRAVSAQTDAWRRAQRASGLYDLIRLGRVLPLGIKRSMPALLPLTGNRFLDTIVLSNLGRVTDAPRFGDEPPAELRFSPPCAMPLGVGVGVVTVGDVMHVVVRHRLEQLGPDAAAAFADLYLEVLGA